MKPAIDVSERIWRIEVLGTSIICIDYNGCREAEMIELGTLATDFLLACDGPQLTLTNFKNTFTTPAFVRHMEKKAPLVKHLILRNALVGLNTAKMMILKGFNLLIGTDFRPFASEHAGIEYLIGKELDTLAPQVFPERSKGQDVPVA